MFAPIHFVARFDLELHTLEADDPRVRAARVSGIFDRLSAASLPDWRVRTRARQDRARSAEPGLQRLTQQKALLRTT
jgi:hypothetical protein